AVAAASWRNEQFPKASPDLTLVRTYGRLITQPTIPLQPPTARCVRVWTCWFAGQSGAGAQELMTAVRVIGLDGMLAPQPLTLRASCLKARCGAFVLYSSGIRARAIDDEVRRSAGTEP